MFVCVRLCSFALLACAGHLVHELLLFMNVRLCSFARLEQMNKDHFCEGVPGCPEQGKPNPMAAAALPSGWEVVTAEDGRVYYWNVSTDETSCT
jgi:hypothetical protein